MQFIAARLANIHIQMSYPGVNVSTGLSPGIYTQKLATLRDLQARKRRAVATTKAAKLRRITLKSNRNQKTSACEIREGTTYKSNAALCDLKEEDINEIPPPSSKPENNAMCLEDATEYTQIYFDIEATGLSRTSHITQLSAIRGEEMFSTYVLQSCEITSKAAEITGLTFQNNSLFPHIKTVPALQN
ncbi:unnamed protein product [Mytilus edulis]|uniref:Exonuclease domain-containing protein n=1 Tax=Mytilus edulis TaxID=6550 RepID=A0A8S3RAH0_MYTED|nr:unnamed protein product [Mytilus edulis]